METINPHYDAAYFEWQRSTGILGACWTGGSLRPLSTKTMPSWILAAGAAIFSPRSIARPGMGSK